MTYGSALRGHAGDDWRGLKKAIRHLAPAEQAFLVSGHLRNAMRAIIEIGKAYISVPDPVGARRCVETALDRAEKVGGQRWQAEALLLQSRFERKVTRAFEKAEAAAVKAFDEARAGDLRVIQAEALLERAKALLARNRSSQAEGLLSAAPSEGPTHRQRAMAVLLRARARVYQGRGDLAREDLAIGEPLTAQLERPGLSALARAVREEYEREDTRSFDIDPTQSLNHASYDRELRKRLVTLAMRRTGQVKSKAIEELGISRGTLDAWLKEFAEPDARPTVNTEE